MARSKSKQKRLHHSFALKRRRKLERKELRGIQAKSGK